MVKWLNQYAVSTLGKVSLYLFQDQLCLQKCESTLTKCSLPSIAITMKYTYESDNEFRSPFEVFQKTIQQVDTTPGNGDIEKQREETLNIQCKILQNLSASLPEWSPAFPQQENERLSTKSLQQEKSVSSKQLTQSERLSKQKQAVKIKQVQKISIQSLNRSPSYELSLQFDEEDLNLEFFEFEDLQYPSLQPEAQNPQGYGRSGTAYDNNRIKKDLNEVFQQLLDQGKGRVLFSKKLAFEVRDEEWLRRQDKVIAARAFINRGYGINQLKQELRQGNYGSMNIDDCRYKSVAGSMVRESFRKMEAFLLRDCQQKLHSMAGYEMKLLQTLLLNCRTTLSPLHARYFLQIVSITYTISDTSIYQSQCMQLYNAIYKSLQKKIALLRGQRLSDSYSSDERPRRNICKTSFSGQVDANIITPNIQREIIVQYIHTPSLSQVRDIIRSKYRISESKLNVKVVRNILRRVMRAAIRRMEDVMADRGMRNDYRNYQRLSDEKIKYVLQVGDGIKLRGQICRVYLGEFSDSKLIQRTCRELCEFLRHRGHHKVHSIAID